MIFSAHLHLLTFSACFLKQSLGPSQGLLDFCFFIQVFPGLFLSTELEVAYGVIWHHTNHVTSQKVCEVLNQISNSFLNTIYVILEKLRQLHKCLKSAEELGS